jgi:hypothetical protein
MLEIVQEPLNAEGILRLLLHRVGRVVGVAGVEMQMDLDWVGASGKPSRRGGDERQWLIGLYWLRQFKWCLGSAVECLLSAVSWNGVVDIAVQRVDNNQPLGIDWLGKRGWAKMEGEEPKIAVKEWKLLEIGKRVGRQAKRWKRKNRRKHEVEINVIIWNWSVKKNCSWNWREIWIGDEGYAPRREVEKCLKSLNRWMRREFCDCFCSITKKNWK